MEKVTKKHLNVKLGGREWIEKEVDFVDPELVDTKDMTCFYFSERSYILDGEEVYEGKKIIISPTYYVGTRISVLQALEITNQMSRDYFKRLAHEYPNVSICKTDLGYLEPIWDEEAITLEEYIASKNKSKN